MRSPIVNTSQPKNTATATENYAYYDGDHWKSWIGPRISSDVPHATELMAEVERVFQSVNLIKECCDRHVNCLLGKMPHWYLKGEDGERVVTIDENGERVDSKAAQAEIDLQRWIDAVLQRADSGQTKQNDPFIQVGTDLIVTGKAALRLWQPERFSDDPDPINTIHLHAAKYGSVEVKRDDDDFIDEISYSYGNSNKEVATLDGDTLTVTTTRSGEEESEPLRIDTGGRWNISILRSPSMLTPQIKQNQNAVNHAATMLLRNQEQAGFLERIFLNAQPPGEWVEDPQAPGNERFVPSEHGLHHGPGEDIFVVGVPSGDPQNQTYSNTSVAFRDPVKVATFLESIAGFRAFIYHAFGQGHLLAEGDGNISGVSRVQLRQDFEVILNRHKRVIEAAIANIFNVVLRILGYTEFEAVVQLRVTTGKLTPDERRGIIEEFQAGLLSKATAIALLGSVEDVDAELALIEEEAEKNLQRRDPPDPMSLGNNPNGGDDDGEGE